VKELERRALWFVVIVGIIGNYCYTTFRASTITFPDLVTVTLSGLMARQDKSGETIYIPVYKEKK
jgi:hypothetical protein